MFSWVNERNDDSFLRLVVRRSFSNVFMEKEFAVSTTQTGTLSGVQDVDLLDLHYFVLFSEGERS